MGQIVPLRFPDLSGPKTEVRHISDNDPSHLFSSSPPPIGDSANGQANVAKIKDDINGELLVLEEPVDAMYQGRVIRLRSSVGDGLPILDHAFMDSRSSA